MRSVCTKSVSSQVGTERPRTAAHILNSVIDQNNIAPVMYRNCCGINNTAVETDDARLGRARSEVSPLIDTATTATGSSSTSHAPAASVEMATLKQGSLSNVNKQSEQAIGTKTIGNFGSFSLVSNNIAGPGMMSLPHVYSNAGYVPSLLCTLWIYVGSSFCGTLIAEVVSSFPGNAKFDKNIEFSAAFSRLGGHWWSVLAESLFILSCMVQCFSGIVEVAHSLDTIIASSLLGETYAIQLYPSVTLLTWSGTACVSGVEAQGDVEGSCSPFHHEGVMLISLGYFLASAILFPFSTGNLEETVSFQVFAFLFMCFVVLIFLCEFFTSGLNYSMPMFGPDPSCLIGVVLFNYTFSITIPAWLNEKQSHVSVNSIVWGSNSAMTIMYILFGLFGAMSMSYPPTDMLSVLGSKKSNILTRICTALFGIITIGSGVPVYCVLIKNTLYVRGTCDRFWSFFIGSVFPYLSSFLIYQGTFMIALLSWTGLVVNGIVAFVMPLLLALFLYEARKRSLKRVHDGEELEFSRKIHRTSSGGMISVCNSSSSDLGVDQEDASNNISFTTNELVLDGSVYPFLEALVPVEELVVKSILILFVLMIVLTIIRNLVRDMEGLTDDYSASI